MYKEMFYAEELENMVEEAVFEQLHLLIEEKALTFCQCEVCIQDIAAIVLNKIPPRYASNLIEKQFPRQETLDQQAQSRLSIREALHEAIIQVKAHAHH